MESLIDFIGTHIPQIAGTLIMAAIVAYFAGLNNRRNRFAVASEKFRSTILTEFKGLYPTPFDWPKSISHIGNILQTKFPIIQTAILEFRPHLGWFKRKRFDRAWLNYYDPIGDGKHQYYGHYMPIDNNPNYKENFKHNVDSLLKFAK